MKLLYCIAFFVIFLGCKKSETLPTPNDLNLLLQKINTLRQSGCNCGSDYMPPVGMLSTSILLDQAAKAHAQDMDQGNYFSHISPNGDTPQERAVMAGYNGHVKAENLGKGYSNAAQVINAWKISVSHCKAMMDANSKEAGVGFSRNYWTVSFGNPL